MIQIDRDATGNHTWNGKLPNPVIAQKKPIRVEAREMPECFQVNTKEGIMEGWAGDYLVTGIRGEMYPCDRKIFEESFIIIEKAMTRKQ